jgi:hypothetical protein
MGVITIRQAKKGVKWAIKKSRLEKYLSFTIQNHGNHGKLVLSHSYECQRIQTKNVFDKILSLNFDLGPLKVNTYCIKLNQFCKGLSKGLI